MLKINLGCGKNIYQGWINIDDIDSPGIFKHDLRKPLPFENNSISFFFSEHFFEHLDEVDGFNLLKHLYDKLCVGGVLRISMPYLDEILNTYYNWDVKKNNHLYLSRFKSKDQFLNFAFFGESSTSQSIKFLSNITSTNDGHKFIYSKEDITKKLKDIGFKVISFKDKNISEFEELKNLETREQICDLILEAIK